jgi:glycosyltransferase involved in cell wall biosynthesis
MAKIGIVTISFNQAKFLPQAIDSVQLDEPHELAYVIVDPGSTDGSRDIILNYKECFSEIIFERDRGPADGLNKGFSACDAEIFGYLNSDDCFAPGALNFVADFFQKNPDVDILLGACAIIDESGRAKLRKRLSLSFTPKHYMQGTALAIQQATFFRKRAWERVSGFNTDNRISWDTELLIDMALAGAKIRIINKVLGYFRIYKDSITSSIRSSEQMYKEYRQQEQLISQKILAAGVKPDPSLLVFVNQLAFRLNPLRRILEYAVQ